MVDRKVITDTVSVSGQIRPEDMQALKNAGITTVVNNRPDNEEPGQPSSADLKDAAEAAGLTYAEAQITPGERQPEAEATVDEVLKEAEGGVHMFCRSGGRSAALWAFSQARLGRDPDTIIAEAGQAGYDLRGLRGSLAHERQTGHA
jgi:uncharacterized protein (TIGR01244 family)